MFIICLENAPNKIQLRNKVNHVKQSYLNMYLAILNEVLSFMNQTKQIISMYLHNNPQNISKVQ